MAVFQELSGGMLRLSPYTFANIPTAVGRTGLVAYVEDGFDGKPCLAISNGTNWVLFSDSATVISAS